MTPHRGWRCGSQCVWHEADLWASIAVLMAAIPLNDISPFRGWRTPICALVLLLLAAITAAAAPTFPELSGRVVDEAGILSSMTREDLGTMLAEHERATGEQVVVVTLKSLQGYDIADYGYQLGRHWGIGEKGKNTGALLIVAPNERKVRIEVGYGLEDKLTDAQSRVIIERVILPQFRRDDFNAGVRDGAAEMLRVLGGGKAAAGEAGGGSYTERASMTEIVLNLAVTLFLCFLLLSWTFNFFHPGRRRTGSGMWIGGLGGGDSFGGGSSGGFSGGGGSFGGGGAAGGW